MAFRLLINLFSMRRVSVTLCAVLDAAGVVGVLLFLAICKEDARAGIVALLASVLLWVISSAIAETKPHTNQ